jgi:acyl-CoA reductase-like NAD-dependent aldehyde dehydrogenase
LREAGFPEGLIQRLPATREAGRELAEADVDHVVFTGHVGTGRVLAATLGRRLVSSALELSGHDAQVLLDDADMALAARAAWFGVTLNRGQTCLAVRRAFVPRDLQSSFLDCMSRLAAGSAPVRLVAPAQASAVEPLIQEALAEGARLLAPVADSLPPGFFQPNVLADVRPHMAICKEAIFVPLLAVLPYDRLEEVLAAEEQCPFALGASIFSQNPTRAKRLAAHFKAGVVSINDVLSASAHPATPLAARKASGWGVTQGAEGLLEMTVPQVVSVRYGSSRPHYEPLAPQRPILEAVLQADHAATWRQRARALLTILRNFLKAK